MNTEAQSGCQEVVDDDYERVRPPQHATLVHALKHNVEHNPNHVFIKWINDECNVESTLTYQQLWGQSGLVVDLLSRHGVKAGDRVMIAYKFGLDFLGGLFGCMRHGAIACSVYPPNFLDKSKMKHSYDQFNTQVMDAGAKFALTTTDFKRGLQLVAGVIGCKTRVRWLPTDKLKKHTPVRPEEPAISSDDVAFIQYSSGSTGAPKGVVISHCAIVHNIHCLKVDSEIQDGSVGVCWMPQYHDFALVGCYLMSFFVKATLVACSPISFIRNPILWADMLDKFEGTHTGGPNFSFALLAKRLKAANRNLSNTRLIRASIGGEPIAPKTLQDVQDIGIKKAAINPCYGMAETCLRVTLAVGDEVRVLDGVVSVGYLPRDIDYGRTIKVANTEGQIVADGEVGEIFIRGPDLALGYWNKPDLDYRFHRELSDGEEYFSTGDLGRIVEDRLYIVGRCKELIIINGRNIYPTDIERLIENEYPDIIRPGSTVAFQRSDRDVGIVFEIRDKVGCLKSVPQTTFSFSSQQNLVSEFAGVGVGQIVALRQGTVPKTTSGKLRRVETQRRSLDLAWKDRDVLDSWALASDNDELATGRSKQEALRLEKQVTETIQPSGDIVESLFVSVLGVDFDATTTWTELGLTSVAHAELSGLVEERLRIKLPSNFHEKYPTPADLRSFIDGQSGKRFPVELPILTMENDCPLPKPLVLLIQGIGICFILLVLIAAFASAFAVGSLCPSGGSVENSQSYGETYCTWIWPALSFPTFAISFSWLVIAAKWIVIGRYRASHFNVYSSKYIRWWLIDRLVHMWELWVGVLIVDTPLIWLFYRLLGSEVHPRSEIKGFIREFDLVKVGSHTTIKQQIRCRRFGPWTDDSGPTLRFRPTEIGSQCVIDGLVGLGSQIGDCVHLDKMSVLSEGAQVEAGTYATGNPAFDGGKEFQGNDRVSCSFMVAQILWLIAELYLFFWLFLFSKFMFHGLLTTSWRYKELMYWILSLMATSFLALIVSAGLKWLMICRRTTSDRTYPCFWLTFAEWACDYHYRVSATLLYAGSITSRLWNVILMVHGLDIDLKSAVSDVYSVPPSAVDQLFVRRTFLGSRLSFRSGERIEIMDSTIGERVTLQSGIKIHRSTVRAYLEVDESVFDERPCPTKVTWSRQLLSETISLVCFLLLCSSFIPSFEVYKAVVSSSGAIFPCYVASITSAFVTQFASWWLLAFLVQAIALRLLHTRPSMTTLSDSWYPVYIHIVWFNNTWGHWFLLWGSPFHNWLAWSLGTKIKGDFFFNGKAQHDFHALTFEDKTIVDDCQLNGHTQLGTEVSVESSVHCGVLHEGCFTMAGTLMEGSPTTETGPLRAVLGQTRSLNSVTVPSLPNESIAETIDSDFMSEEYEV